MVLEKTLESPLDCKEIQPVHSEGDHALVGGFFTTEPPGKQTFLGKVKKFFQVFGLPIGLRREMCLFGLMLPSASNFHIIVSKF